MKLEIYQEKPEEIKEQIVRLALVQEGNGVLLHVVDKDGNRVECGNLIKFYNDGVISRSFAVNPSLGFQLNKRGQIKEEYIYD